MSVSGEQMQGLAGMVAGMTHVATLQPRGPVDEQESLVFRLEDHRRLATLPAGTRLYAALPGVVWHNDRCPGCHEWLPALDGGPAPACDKHASGDDWRPLLAGNCPGASACGGEAVCASRSCAPRGVLALEVGDEHR